MTTVVRVTLTALLGRHEGGLTRRQFRQLHLAVGPARLLRLMRSAPLTSSVVLLVLIATLLLRTHPADLDDVVAWSSTNIHNLARHPVSSLVASAFVIPGNVLPELALVTAGLLMLERAIGTRQALAVAAGGHVLATVLTEYGAELAGRLHLIAVAPDRPDVGISYLMFAVLGGAIVLRPGVPAAGRQPAAGRDGGATVPGRARPDHHRAPAVARHRRRVHRLAPARNLSTHGRKPRPGEWPSNRGTWRAVGLTRARTRVSAERGPSGCYPRSG